jgi:hypothetical protein
MAGRLAVASGSEDQRLLVAAEACAVPCTPKAAASDGVRASARVAGAEPCAASCTAKAPLATARPAARAARLSYAASLDEAERSQKGSRP